MKYLVYKVKTPLGYVVDLWTDTGKKKTTYADLLDKEREQMRIMNIEKTGAKVLKGVNVSEQTKPLAESTTEPQDRSFCTVHKTAMQLKKSQYGEFYSHAQKMEDGSFVYCKGKGWGK